jgi:hypothetical protein
VTAAIIIGRTAGARRFATDACFARHSGTAPIPASSGNTTRHRLHRGRDRQLNRAIHIIALCRARNDPQTRAYLAPSTPKAKPNARRCTASNATSHDTSGRSSTRPTPHPNRYRTHHQQPSLPPHQHSCRAPAKPAASVNPLT